MGTRLNPSSLLYQMVMNSEIFVDKHEMVPYLSSVVNWITLGGTRARRT